MGGSHKHTFAEVCLEFFIKIIIYLWWGGLLFIIIYLWYHGTYCFPLRRNDQTEHVLFYWLRSMGFVHCLEITTRWRYYKVLTLFSFVPLTSPDILYVFTVFSTCHQKAASSFSSARPLHNDEVYFSVCWSSETVIVHVVSGWWSHSIKVLPTH